jgi:hypothetical protein
MRRGLGADAYGFPGLLALGLAYLDTFRIAQDALVLALLLCGQRLRSAKDHGDLARQHGVR